MKGQQRTEIVQHPGLIAVEARDFQNEDRINKGKRVTDLLDGNDSIYQRKLAVFQASDNPEGPAEEGHGLHGIGETCAYFKMEKIDLESLRQCFLDPDVRIKQDFELEQHDYPRIGRVTISSGFLEEQTVVFNQGLNSILGGKGTGKSLLVELLRFALNQPPVIEAIELDHKSKLKSRLGDLGIVQVDYVDETGQVFEIKRVLDPVSSGYDIVEYDLSQVCQVLFLSQNEIIRIAEDKSLQLHFIDSFFPSKAYEERIEALETSLHDLDKQMADGLRAVGEIAELKESIATTEVKIKRLDTKLDAPIFKTYTGADEKRQAIQSYSEYFNEVEQLTICYKENVDSLEIPVSPSALANDSVLKQNMERIDEAKNHIHSHIDAIMGKLSDVQELVKSDQQMFKKWFEHTRKQYLEHVRGEGGDQVKFTSEREKLQKQLKAYEARLHVEQLKETRAAEFARAREKKLDEIDALYREWRRERKERCEHFQNSSEGKLQLNIIEFSNRDEFRNRLIGLKRGTNLRDTDISKLATSVQPRSFVQKLLEYQNQRRNSSHDQQIPLKVLAESAEIPLDRIVKLADFLLANSDIERLLELQYMAYPKDRPEIKFRVGREKFESLETVSVGQKCTALLIMAMTDGQMPVVIDQPEDSLDIRSIWEDICARVRDNKHRRQFIFTTHNSSVAVASDTDNFIILEADSEKGNVVFSGSMDTGEIGDEVLKYLEGGTDPYRKKFLKYRANKRLRA